MDEAFYEVWTMKPTEAYYALSEEDRNAMFAKLFEAQKVSQMESVIMCNCSWSTEKWLYFGMEKYANMDVMLKQNKGVLKMNWWRYVDVSAHLFRLTEPMKQLAPLPAGQTPIYKLAFMHLLPDGWRMPKEQQDEIFGKLDEDLKKVGGEPLLFGRIFSTDYYQFVTVERYPNLAAVAAHMDCMIDMGWFQWLEAEAFLGTPFEGNAF